VKIKPTKNLLSFFTKKPATTTASKHERDQTTAQSPQKKAKEDTATEAQ